MADNSKVVSPKHLAHIVLRTSNYASMVAFYKTFLGAQASLETPAMAFLTYDYEHHRIAIANIPDTKPRDPTVAGLAHVAFTFDSLDDLFTAYTQRRDRGILPIWCVNHGPTISLYYQDPDGNQIETQVDVFDTAEAASEFMMSPEFLENPIGVDLDPEDMISRLKKGEDPKGMMRRAKIGPRGRTRELQHSR
ncbi:Glyoxalase/Bleomycin resistance protein/Dihydroxybiphenyl dioxygenase [Thozetella sp. PMI_491]|nr:Glyoxalase/Bleomycin resistance protein/Dihydroxybiphenyl dioxygenase [Thozetella sp. PMI_491]